jgi:hypothetical protein
MPLGIPSSFNFEGRDSDGQYKGSIKYSIKAYTYENAKSSWIKIHKDKKISFC